jgi:hypothetical protein
MKRIKINRLKQVNVNVKKSLLALNLRKVALRLTALAVVLAIVSGVFWYKDIYMTDERRFWLAMDNSMATPSVVRTLTSGGTGNQVIQENRFFFSPDVLSQSRVEFSNRSATVETTVVTEGISTLDSQFSRYIQFETNDPREDGTVPSLDEVLGKWAGQTAPEEEEENARLNYVSELVTLAIFGNFDPAYRSQVIETFKSNDTYRIATQNIVEDTVNGETVLVYPVSVGLQSFAEQLQAGFVRTGLGDFPPLNPDNYREDSRVSAQIAVRKKDNTIVGILFGDRQESYQNYGVQKEVELPSPEFTPQELETTVQNLVQG